METWRSASALARPIPMRPNLIRMPGRHSGDPHPDDLAKVIRGALFSSANVLFSGDTDQAERYLRSVLERRIVSINAAEDSPNHLLSLARRRGEIGMATVLVRNIDRLNTNEQFELLDLLEGDSNPRPAVPRGIRLISTAKSDLERATACATFLPSLLFRIGTISIHVPNDFFEVMTHRQRKFSIGGGVLSSRLEDVRA